MYHKVFVDIGIQWDTCYKEGMFMIKLENHLGWIDISHEFLVNLIVNTATNCFGVAGMSNCNNRQGLKAKLLHKEPLDKGILVRYKKEKLIVDLHILVIYGMNISAVVKSIINKVRYAVEEVTGITVSSVNVFIDGMKA